MAQMSLPAEPSYRRTSYSELRGVDFSQDPALVDRRHSPDALNMVSDNGGNPVKRKGFKLFTNPADDYGPNYVQNIWSFIYNTTRYVVFTVYYADGAKVYVTDENGTKLSTYRTGSSTASTPTVEPGKRIGFYTEANSNQTGFYIMSYKTGISANYLRIYVSSGTVYYEEVDPKTPTVIIGRSPNGGGIVYEDANLLTNERIELFYNPEGLLSFQTTADINTSKAYSVRYKNAQNQWQAIGQQYITVSGRTVTITAEHRPPVEGEDNIEIRYFRTGTDYSGRITNCEVFSRNSGATSEQIFVSGNPYYRSSIYYSAPNDVTYFPDMNYMSLGGETKIMGFVNLGEYLGVVKESATNDSTLYLLYQTSLTSRATSTLNTATNQTVTDTEQIQTFAVKRSAAGIGASSRYAFSVLNDEPLFLAPNGVYGIVSTNTTSEKVVRNRSRFLDAKLTKEAKDVYEVAVGTTWNNYYVLAVNGANAGWTQVTDTYIQETDSTGTPHYVKVDAVPEEYTGPVMTKTYDKPTGRMYVLDGRHKTNDQSGNTNYGYEAYYWEGISARALCAFGDTLLMGAKGGRVYVFKNTGEATDYSDEYFVTTTITEDGETTTTTAWEQYPIVARWSTPNDNDGASEYFKTMQKKGTMCTTAPFEESSVKVYISADSGAREYLGMAYLDIATMFNEVKFDRLSFDTRTGPRDTFFRKKKKKYIRLQIILENDQVNEPFGVFEIVKTYVLQRFAKGTRLKK